MKKRVLFVCVHNSARSQMAEAFLNHLAGDCYEAESAGLEPGKINPVVVEVMREEGIDISGNKTKGVFGMYKAGKRFHYVITVCEGAAAERCPIFPSAFRTIRWTFDDPSRFEGTHEEKLEKTREVRDRIKQVIEEWATCKK